MARKDSELTGVKEIARRANVSIGTVDRVIHNRKGVSKKTKDKINAIIKELDYQPNIFARRLASKKQLVFAILIPKVSQETNYWEAPLLGIEQAGAEISPYGITVQPYLYEVNDKKSFLEQVARIDLDQVQGVLLAPSFIEESAHFIKALESKKIPYVFINSDIPGYNSLSYFGPDLYQSGYLSAHLMKYLVKRKEKVLIINISQEIDDQHHLSRKEQGFRNYFKDHKIESPILKIDIQQTDYAHVSKALGQILRKEPVAAIFVTNSRVSTVAKYLKKTKDTQPILIGFDYTKENLVFLKEGIIDFLICQKPREQGYKGLMALYQFVLHSRTGEKNNFMPIDIITSENCDFYIN
ncbi:substrate-binding domain-containing protein [Chitinophaga qingshengii]|uniref:Substrate-binding domain-containing protein n=1 Tax=Chitinophaga qingshengii TaxID=1569794 RepID=A0ABR7TML5_9BACT|nr:substrate-binding domain-containing protein [Chitinophaga qingshengii]MBC9930294.1 substrate-binding domain-containing protein [Chitinophaga qingshengii]